MKKNKFSKYNKVLLIIVSLLIPTLFLGCASTSKVEVVKNHTQQVQDENTLESLVTNFKSFDTTGNIILSISSSDFLNAGYKFGDVVSVDYKGKNYTAPVVFDSSDVDDHSFFISANEQNVKFGIRNDDSKTILNATIDDEITISLKTEFGFLVELEVKYLETSLDRDDYSTDEAFANFRQIDLGSINSSTLYRSCSPVAFSSRSSYTTELAQKAGIKNIVNLANNYETLKNSLELLPNSWYENLYEDGNVVLVNMNDDYNETEFGLKIAQALKFIANNEGPYLIHCGSGKSRTGFIFVLIEALMGANQSEIEDDFMLSYSNYYNIQKGTYQYNYIKQAPYKMLAAVADGITLDSSNFQLIANNYLEKIGLTKQEIESLKENLSK